MVELKAIIMKPIDNVCTVVGTAKAGTVVTAETEGKVYTVTLRQDIPFAHKFALLAIKKGEPIRKYGEIIGIATQDIRAGDHVHVHNLESCRGRGDKKQ